MGKKSSKSQSKEESKPAAGGLPFLSGSASLDPTLSSLFASSSGPVQAPSVKYTKDAAASKSAKKADEVDAEEDEVMEDASASASEESDSEPAEEKADETHRRKRKRAAGEEVEETYMRRIAKEEQKDDEKRKAEYAKRQKSDEKSDEKSDKSDNSDDEDDDEEKEDKDSDDEEKSAPPPVHESVSGNAKASEVEKSSRTVFLGNVSTEAIKSKTAKKTLLRHLASHLSSLPESSGPHKVQSIRFRSVPFASGGELPKRASFARREILDDTTPSTNAYAVYTTIQGARKAPSALNGTVVLDRHIRVDSIAHPAEIDNKRCVFVGNLDFVDQEGITEDHNGKKKKARASADIEEGLWRIFNQNTGDTKDKKTIKKNVEFVRVIRDRATRVGKGFAYVQFFDANNVESALLLNEKNYPPMLPRKLRVTRARKMAKKQEDEGKNGRRGDLAQKTLQGRANKLLGRAGAAKIKEAGKGGIAGNSMVFEGHRATEEGNRMKVKVKSRGSKGKPKGRSSKRAAAYRAAGGQKP